METEYASEPVREVIKAGGMSISFEYVDDEEYERLLEESKNASAAAEAASAEAMKMFWQKTIKDGKSLHDWTGFDLDGFRAILSSFAKKWTIMERAEMERRQKYAKGRKGRRGPRPRADVIMDRMQNIPLIHDDPARNCSPGNRCKLEPLYMLIMALVRKYRNTEEIVLAALFGVSQPTVSRLLRTADRILEDILPTPERFLEALRGVDSPRAFVDLFPNGSGKPVIIFDGTHARFARPSRAEERDPMISNKKKFPSGNTMVMTAGDGMIMAIGRTHPGRVHDIVLLRELIGGMGAFGRMLQGLPPGSDRDVAMRISNALEAAVAAAVAVQAGTAAKALPAPPALPALPTDIRPSNAPAGTFAEKITPGARNPAFAILHPIPKAVTNAMGAMFDHAQGIPPSVTRGMQILCNSTPAELGIIDSMGRLRNPPKDKIQSLADAGFTSCDRDLKGADAHTPCKKPPGGELTPLQREYNRLLSKNRMPVENEIGSAKHFKRVSTIYNGSLDEFNREFNIAAGLANLRRMLRNGSYNHWAKKLGLYTINVGR